MGATCTAPPRTTRRTASRSNPFRLGSRYYGSMAILSAREAVHAAGRTSRRLPGRIAEIVAFERAVRARWLFPVDFLIEIVTYLGPDSADEAFHARRARG